MHRRTALSGLAALPFLTGPARAQPAYPDRPVRVAIGFAAGGSTDVTARLLAPGLQALLGQPFVVDNRPGAGGNIATELVAHAPPDGTTLLLGTIGPLAINPTLYRTLSFDPLADLTPITRVGAVLNVLAVPADRSWRTFAELLTAARAAPDTLTYGSSGVGGAGHLAGEELNQLANLRLIHVPYRGGAALAPDLLSGKVDLAFTTAHDALTQAEAGRLRILAVPTLTRSPLLPAVPAIAETIPGFEAVDWSALLGPRGLPEPIVTRLAGAFRTVLTDPAMVRTLAARGVDLAPSTPAELARFLRDETAKWAPIVRASGASPT